MHNYSPILQTHNYSPTLQTHNYSPIDEHYFKHHFLTKDKNFTNPGNIEVIFKEIVNFQCEVFFSKYSVVVSWYWGGRGMIF